MSLLDLLDSWTGATALAVGLHVGAALLPWTSRAPDQPLEVVAFELIEVPAPLPETPELPPGQLNEDPEADPDLPSVTSNRPPPPEPAPSTPIVTGAALDTEGLVGDGPPVQVGNTDEPGFEAAPGTDLSGVGGFEGGGRGGGGDGPVVRADRAARLVRFFEPPYPKALVNSGIEGRVVLEVEVLPNGRAGKTRVISSVHPELSQVAQVAVKRYRWRPATREGEKVASLERVAFRFVVD